MSPPHLCLPPGGVPALRERAALPELKHFRDRLLVRCDRWLGLPPIEVPPKPSTREDRSPRELMRSRHAQGRIVSLACGWHLTGNRAYLDRCWAEIEVWLVRWKSWTDPYHGGHDEYDLMVGEVALGLGLAYDWLKADLPPARAATLRDHLARRALDLYLAETEGTDRQWWCGVTHNWNAVCNGGAVVAALALGTAYPRTDLVLARATGFLDGYLKALREEGGCDEGLGYWQYGMRYCVAALAGLRDSGREVGGWLARPGFRRTGRFPASFLPGSVPISWGDAASNVVDPCLYWLADNARDPEVVRYADRALTPFAAEAEGWPLESLALCWRPVGTDWLPPAGSPSGLPTAQVWREIGWSCFTDSWESPTLATGLKCGDLGANHTHLDNNGLLLWARGEWLASDLGPPPVGKYGGDYFSEKRWDMYIVKTAGHNAVTIGGRGQKPHTPGRIEPLPAVSPRVAGAVGDATANYGPPVRRARRHFAVVDRAVVVLLDEIETDGDASAEWRLHSIHPIRAAGDRAEITAPRAALHVLFPKGAVAVSVLDDPEHLAPDKKDTVLLAVAAPARTRLLPAVLFPAAPGEPAPAVTFTTAPDRVAVTVPRPAGAVTLAWRPGRAGWALTSAD